MDPRKGIKALRAKRAEAAERLRNAGATATADMLDSVRLDWYLIRNASDEGSSGGSSSADSADIFIYEEIGGWFGTPADEFVKDLHALNVKNINLRINSPGGSVWDAIAIYNALVAHPATVTVYVDALAASAASVIAMAGDRIIMMVGSQMMIHDASGICLGNEAETREFAAFLGKQSDNLASVYADRAGGTAEEWRALMKKETWMFADEAVEFKLADEVFTRPAGAPEEEPEEEPEPEEDESEAEESDESDEEEGDTGHEAEDEDDESEPDDFSDLMSATWDRIPFARYPNRQAAPAPVKPRNSKSFADLLS